MQRTVDVDGINLCHRGLVRSQEPSQSGPDPRGILRVGGRLLSGAKSREARALWSVLVVVMFFPVLALADTVEIGYLSVENSCEPAPRAPAGGIVCSGSVAVFNETTNATLFDVSFDVGGVIHDTASPNEQIIGPLTGEDVQIQDFTNWYVFVPRLTVLSVQADFIVSGFTSTFLTRDLGGPNAIAGMYDLTPSGADIFGQDVESLQFDADFQGTVPIFADATAVIPVNPVVTPEPGTCGLILTAISLLFVMRKTLSAPA